MSATSALVAVLAELVDDLKLVRELVDDLKLVQAALEKLGPMPQEKEAEVG